MDETARALADLSAIEDQIAGMNGGELLPVLVRRRGALRRKVPTAHLAAYDALERFHRRPVVVPVRRSHCGGCHLRVPPQLESLLRRNPALMACPHCQRLLYLPREDRAESASAPSSKAASARPPVPLAVRVVAAPRRKREPQSSPARASRR